MTGALQNPRWRMVFSRHNEIVGCAVETDDGKWRATKGPNTFATFDSLEECKRFLIARAADQGGRDEAHPNPL
jgi:hypothetical protein